MNNKQTQEQDTRDKAIEWWNNTLNSGQRVSLIAEYYGDDKEELYNEEMEHIYLSENKNAAQKKIGTPFLNMANKDTLCVEGESLNVGLTGGEWGVLDFNSLSVIAGEFNLLRGAHTICMINEKSDKATDEQRANARLIAQSKNMYYFLKILCEKDYPIENFKREAKALLSNIDNK